MLLYEFEGKKIFANCGINIPKSQLITLSNGSPIESGMTAPVILKAQTLSGKRAEGGGIVKVKENGDLRFKIQELFKKTINGEKVEKILVEEMVTHDEEYYLSFSYSTETRTPLMTFGKGGTGAEEKGAKSYQINILEGFEVEKFKDSLGVNVIHLPGVLEVIEKLWQVFTKYDCELVEINPLVVANNSKAYALDAKVILDDDADFRREEKFEERNLFGRSPTHAEIDARKIDEGDHRGTAGSVYWDLNGDIAVIAAGGGGSVVNMDSLIAFGGKPANYTEHSGNPPREKLKKLTKIVLSKKGLKGCWIVGGTANFTDIYETLSGVVEGLREINPKPNYPIVIRRGGPRDEEAFVMLREVGKEEGFDFHIYGRETPMSATAKVMVELAYGNKNVKTQMSNVKTES